MCVIMCTNVLYRVCGRVGLLSVVAGVIMSDPTKGLLLETLAQAPGMELQR